MELETPVGSTQNLSMLTCVPTNLNVTPNRLPLGTLHNIIHTNGPQQNPPLQTPSLHNLSSNRENVTPLQTPCSYSSTSVGSNVSVDPAILTTREYNKSYYQGCKQKEIAEENANMEPETSVRATQNLSAITCETTLDHPHGSNVLFPLFNQEYYKITDGNNVDVEPTTQLRKEYHKSYYQHHKQKNIATKEDPYGFVYNGLPKEHSLLKEQPPCVAGIWVEGNENITTYKRSIVVYGRSKYPTQIQAYFACYDPLSYPTFFLNGEVGWHKRIPRAGVDIRELVDDDDNDGAEDEEDAMTLVQDAGKPDIFFTMTCNPNWPEIMENHYEGQTAQDRPDLVTRVFRAKLEYLEHLLFTKHILGVVSSHIYVIEFQKQGLPHAHFLLIMTSAHKLANPDHYNKVVCAEIPDPNKHQELHQLVLKHMIHSPCGHLNTQCPCMEGEPKKCHWNYPRQFQETTRQRDDSYPLYRQRDNGIEVNVQKNVLENRWVVPYNPTLSMMFNCHIKVEVCSSIKSVKYAFKYIYKGHDKQVVNVEKNEDQVVNKIKRFQDARYVSPPEAMWRIYGFPLSNIQVHLPNNQFVRFREDDVLTNIIKRERNKRSMLTAFFKLNEIDTNARQYLYRDIPRYYTWNKSTRVWKRRKQGKMKGIMVFTNPAEGERFYLRMLLQHVKGPTGFDYLYTVDDVLYTTFRKAALEKGLIKSDSYIHECLRESSTHKLPYALRRLFGTILIFCEPEDVRKLWDDHYESLSEDYTINCASVERVQNMILTDISTILQSIGRSISDFDLPNITADVRPYAFGCRKVHEECSIVVQEEDILARNSLNTDKKNAYDTIMEHVDADSPGVFLSMTLEELGKQAAANNMTGGRTAHSRFKIPINLSTNSMCNIKKQRVKLPFGGKIMVLGWDFRQVLPVVRRGTRAQIVDSSLRMSPLWSIIKRMRLTINIRARTDPWFSNFLLQVSDGVEEVVDKNYVRIPDDMTIPYTNDDASKNALINEIFPSFATNACSSSDIVSRAILSTKNEYVDNINNELTDRFPGEEKRFDPNVINAEIAVGQHAGVRVLLPRIPLAPSEEDMFPFKLKRTQFHIRLSFAMTIYKAQGQTIPNTSVYLPESVFSHGQLYVALSKGISRTTTNVLVKPEKEVDQPGVYTANVVCQEVLRDEFDKPEMTRTLVWRSVSVTAIAGKLSIPIDHLYVHGVNNDAFE
nr:hypothetical protein [Tanacetum cinerariifolium]